MSTREPASRWKEAVVERIEPGTERIKRFFLRAPLAMHEAGQHLDVRLTAEDGYQAQRSYSIASAPGDALIELAIDRLDDGEVSPFFHDVLQPGDTLEVRGPIGGHFVWRPEDGGPLLMIAGGSGIVPLMAIARHRARAAAQVDALLIHSARRWEDLLYRDELARFGSARFRWIAITTRGPKQRAGDAERRLDGSLLHDLLTHWRHRPAHVLVCGANRYVEAATGHLVGEGIAAQRIRAERYGGTA